MMKNHLQKREHFFKMNEDQICVVMPFYRCFFHPSKRIASTGFSSRKDQISFQPKNIKIYFFFLVNILSIKDSAYPK